MDLRIQYLRKYVLWGGIGVAALVFWPMHWMGFTLPKLLVLHLVLGVSSMLFLFDRREWKARVVPLGIVIGYFLLQIIYTVFSPAPLASFFGVTESLQGLLTQLMYLTIFLLALQITDEEKEWGFRIILVVNGVVVFYALLQALRLDPLMGAWDSEWFLGRVFSSLGHPNWLGVWLLLTFPLVLALKKNRWIWVGLQVLALLLTGSKAAFLGFAVFLLGMLFRYKQEWKKILLGGLVVLGTGAFFLSQLYPDNFFLLRSLEARQVIGSNTWSMIESRPWGYGPEVFPFFYPAFTAAELWEYEAFGSTIEHPHNQFLELWIAVGPLGVAMFYAIVLIILLPYVAKNKNGSITDNERILAWGVVSALVAQFFGFETVATSALFWLWLGLLAQKNGKVFYPTKVWKMMMVILAVIHLGGVGIRWTQLQGNFLWDRVKILEESSQVLDAPIVTASDMQKVEGLLIRGSQFSKGHDAEIILLQALLAARQDEDKLALQLYDLAQNKNSQSPRTYYIGMKIFEVLGDVTARNKARNDLCSLVPSYWNQPQTEPGRIFQKNNPWVVKECVK